MDASIEAFIRFIFQGKISINFLKIIIGEKWMIIPQCIN
jgi:hypothetical protein